MSKTYAGVGSRATPTDILQLIETVAAQLAAQGWTLRSGHAPGADQAFERGAGAAAEVYLPWASFEKDVPLPAGFVLRQPAPASLTVAAEYHPGWQYLKRGARSLMGRNVHQVLGADLQSPCQFVLCWTPDGSLTGQGGKSGGTGQALRLATAYGIPVFNLALAEHRDRVQQLSV